MSLMRTTASYLCINHSQSIIQCLLKRKIILLLPRGFPEGKALSNSEAQTLELLPQVGFKAGTLPFVILFIIEST